MTGFRDLGVGADRGWDHRVRTSLVLICLTGCSLYFANDRPSGGGGDDGGVVVDPPPGTPPPAGSVAIVRCEDGELRRVVVPDYAPVQPGHGAGDLVGMCAGSCRSAAYVCPSGDCSSSGAALCDAEASNGTPCSLEGSSCATDSTIECPATTTCGDSLAAASCTCKGGAYACTPHGPTDAIQHQLVGKWVGTVHPPRFSADYDVSLWIYPDGTYWAECDGDQCAAFYYGGDGPYPDRKISILATSPTAGAWANIGIYFGSSPANTGAIESLTVSDTALRFTYNASWLTCGQPFSFVLTRAP
jgi:hypothetical protein